LFFMYKERMASVFCYRLKPNVMLTATWKTVMRAQRRLSKFLRLQTWVTVVEFATLSQNLQPNRFIPRMLQRSHTDIASTRKIILFITYNYQIKIFKRTSANAFIVMEMFLKDVS